MAKHLLHVIPSFASGGAQVRVAQILNHLGDRSRHTLVALDGDFSACTRIDSGVCVTRRTCTRSANPLLMAARLRTIMRERRPDLVLTYNFGALDAVSATLLPPCIRVIHTEDGFGAEEAERQMPRRVLFRRLLLPHVSMVIAPSMVLARIMREQWKLPASRIHYLPNGVDTERFTPSPKPHAREEIVIGTAASLRPEKRLELLLETFASMASSKPARLEIAGDGDERQKLETLAHDLGIATRVTFHGHLEDLPSFYKGLDVFALTSSTEQMPLSILEAMATGLPVVSTDVGDVKNMVAAENRPFIVPPTRLREALTAMLADSVRKPLGAANRAECVARFGLADMLRTYENLYRCA